MGRGVIYGSVCSGIEASKRCSKCSAVKPLADFHRQPGGQQGRFCWCKPCANKYAREKRVRTDTPAQRRKWLLSQRYGMAPVQVDNLISAQGGKCAICATLMKRPCVDHDHATGAVREMLCHPCNIKLHALEDAAFREAALRYLGKHKCAT